MGLVTADIELINAVDMEMAKRNLMDKDEIRRMPLNILVDSGAFMMAINEDIQAQLGIPFIERRTVQVADNRVVELDVVGPIFIKFANRTAICSAFVLPGNSEPLLGAIPMEEMDVIIHPTRQELVVNPLHPDCAVLKM